MAANLRSVRMQRFLAVVIAVLVAAGGLAVALRHRPVEVRKVVTTETELRPGQTEVTGIVNSVTADPAVTTPLALPLTITVPERGAGGAAIANALVGGKRSTIVWDGGRPLPLEGQGSLDVSPATVDVSADGVRWLLDGQSHPFAPGRYTANAPTAVGTSGLATPRDRVDFTADDGTTLTTHNGAMIKLPLQPMRLEGPGTVQLVGRLRLRTTKGSTAADRASFKNAPFVLTLTPEPAGIRVIALFQS
jgi:hypothetical protein